MKKTKIIFTAGAFIFLIIACQPIANCNLTEQEKTSIEQEIETIVKNFMNVETISFETHSALRADQPGYIFGGEGKVQYRSYAEYYTAIKNAFSTTQKFTEINISELHTYALSRNAATCTMEFKSKILTTSGDTLINDGCWTMVFKRFNSEWKIIQENGTHLRVRD